MEELNTGTGSSRSYKQQNVAQIINNITNVTEKIDKVDIEGARDIDEKMKKIIDKVKKKAGPPPTDVIDFKNELEERYPREVQLVPTKYLRFRKNNGRIIADVESYEREYGLLNEGSNDTQKILKGFLASNDRERNEELKRLLKMKGQQRPAIITCDGYLINGNRRKMVLDELLEETGHDRFASMRVIILPDEVSELDIQKVENRYQLQSEGKSEYQGLNRAIKYKRNIQNGFLLKDQLKDDPNFHSLSDTELMKVVREYEKDFINPLDRIDSYLEAMHRPGMYNTITESMNDREGRWQAFVDYSNFYHGTLKKPTKLAQLQLKEDDIGKLETAIFKIIRKRSLNSRSGESPVGKLHEFIRKLPKYLSNPEAKKHILKIAEIPNEVPQAMIKDKEGNKCPEREIDIKWGALNEKEVLSNLFLAQRYVNNQETRDKPLELLEDALKKLNHNNLSIGKMGPEYYQKGMELTRMISLKADEIYKAIDHARYNYKRTGKQEH